MSSAKNITDIVEIATDPNISIIALIESSDIVSKLVMLLLVFASVWTWAVMLDKFFRFSAVQKKMFAFENSFWSGIVLDQLYENVKRNINNPLVAVFVAAMNECKRQNTKDLSYNLKESHKTRISASMYIIRNREMDRLETNLAILSTIANTSPFIALFGTVWGIIHSFQAIGVSKNTSLAVVGPGIAEALIATAIGLFVAIQATIFYHYLFSKLITINNKVDEFIGELESIISRAIDEEKL